MTPPPSPPQLFAFWSSMLSEPPAVLTPPHTIHIDTSTTLETKVLVAFAVITLSLLLINACRLPAKERWVAAVAQKSHRYNFRRSAYFRTHKKFENIEFSKIAGLHHNKCMLTISYFLDAAI